MAMTQQTPPQSLEAEESVLGAMMLSPGAIVAVQETGLAPADFYRQSHGVIYRAACEMFDKGEPVDSITVVDELERRGKLDEIGGRPRVHELAALVPSSANASHYANIVRDTAGARRLVLAGGLISKLGTEREGSLDELMAQAEAALTQAVDPTINSQLGTLADAAAEIIAEIEEAFESGKPKFGLRTGFVDLDRALTGLHPGQLLTLAARPGMGKSALAQNVAENVADAGTPVALFSLEMSRGELALRSISRLSGIDSKQLRSGQFKAADLPRFQEAARSVTARKRLFIDDRGDTTLQKIRAEARRMRRVSGLGLLVVDYLQLMVAAKSDENRQNEVAQLSRGLKLLARELGIPVIALSQLNRQVEARQDKRPMLSDLRDSGAIEQDSDVVVFIYRDDYYNKEESAAPGIADLIVAKNRQGSADTVKLAFVGKTTTFKNLARMVDAPESEAA